MSGIEAVGVAAAILQLVDFGGKLLITGHEAYKSHDGATADTINLQAVSTEVQALSVKLSQPPPKNTWLSENEKALWHLADRAHTLARHLHLLLEDLKLKKKSFRTWGAIRQSWRILRTKDHLDCLVNQLSEIKSLLDTRLLMLLRDNDSLLIRLVNEEIRVSRHAHDENIANLQHLKRELLATAQQYHQASLDNTQDKTDTIVRIIETQLTDLANRCIGLSRSERILSSLYFKEIGVREEGITSAETGTYSWAFDSWNVDGYGFQNHFVNWLEGEALKPFMITGKPGSGKSTFMKFVAQHQDTQKALKRWSADRDLITASFHFWIAGEPMHRSMNGLVRSLLYQILCKNPDMIEKVVPPARWEDTSVERHAYKPWTSDNISTAFQHVLKHEIENLNCNFCFFIDGLDEYEGPDFELVRQLLMLSSSSHVKLCLSSRPRNVFLVNFPSSGPCYLELNCHTQNDIKQLVASKFLELDGLIDISPVELIPLQNAVVERAHGVFLWAELVLRELVKGLKPPVEVSELLERLSMMPPDLNAYFQRMLNKIHKQYRRFTGSLLLMSTLKDLPLKVAEVHSLWEFENNREAPSAQARLTNQGQRLLPARWREETTTRIRKFCGDLLQVNSHGHVEPVHKTVTDFLTLQDVEANLLYFARWHDAADVHLNFCRVQISLAGNLRLTGLRDVADSFVFHARRYEFHRRMPCTEFVHQLNDTLCSTHASRQSKHWTLHKLEEETRYWVRSPQALWAPPKPLALLTWASWSGLYLFVGAELANLPFKNATVISQFLLQALILRESEFQAWIINGTVSIFSLLCTHGASINIPVQYFTCTGSGDHPSQWEMSPTLPSHAASSEVKFFDRAKGLTVWEMYLRTHYVDECYGRLLATKDLLNLRANLNCKLPESCQNIEEAILKMFDSDWTDDTYKRHIRSGLLKRGYIPKSTISRE